MDKEKTKKRDLSSGRIMRTAQQQADLSRINKKLSSEFTHAYSARG
jgi:hypothetical protein